jgi:hypothetical protein
MTRCTMKYLSLPLNYETSLAFSARSAACLRWPELVSGRLKSQVHLELNLERIGAPPTTPN